MSDEITPAPVVVPANTPWFEDKSVHAVLTFLVTLVANAIGRKFGFSLNIEEIVSLAAVVIGFIAGHKWKTAQVQAALVNAASK